MAFKDAYTADNQELRTQCTDWHAPDEFRDNTNDLALLFSEYGGMSFNSGIYRVHGPQEASRWTNLVIEAFPAFKDRIFCFSYDWLGRHFAVDRARQEDGQLLVLMLEPGTGQALEIPTSVRAFHDDELVEYADAALAVNFYQSWLSAGGKVPGITECIGYQKPLFLGGEDSVANLELSDMEVYWRMCGQLLDKIRHLPDGAKLGSINIR